jgi:hypothetical protein
MQRSTTSSAFADLFWENWKEPTSGEWLRTFAIITTEANELVADIHDRMPVILAPADYARWLGDEPDPHDLMRPFPAALMLMWPISTRVNKPENDDPAIVEPIELASPERYGLNAGVSWGILCRLTRGLKAGNCRFQLGLTVQFFLFLLVLFQRRSAAARLASMTASPAGSAW